MRNAVRWLLDRESKLLNDFSARLYIRVLVILFLIAYPSVELLLGALSWFGFHFQWNMSDLGRLYRVVVLGAYLLAAIWLPVRGDARRYRKAARIVFGLAALVAIWTFVDPEIVTYVLSNFVEWSADAAQGGFQVFTVLFTLGVLVLLLLQVPHWRSYWPEAWLIFLLFFMRGVWSLPRPAAPVMSSLSVVSTPSTSAQHATFALSTSKIASDLAELGSSRNLMVILVPEDDKVTPVEGPGWYEAELVSVLDVDKVAIQPPYDNATTVRISVERDQNNNRIVNFAHEFTNASTIYIFPRP